MVQLTPFEAHVLGQETGAGAQSVGGSRHSDRGSGTSLRRRSSSTAASPRQRGDPNPLTSGPKPASLSPCGHLSRSVEPDRVLSSVSHVLPRSPSRQSDVPTLLLKRPFKPAVPISEGRLDEPSAGQVLWFSSTARPRGLRVPGPGRSDGLSVYLRRNGPAAWPLRSRS